MSHEGEVPKTNMAIRFKLAQVITNLVNNAIKFTSSGSVDVSLSMADTQDEHDYLQFVVKDTGKGIVKDKILTLFEPFTQEDTSINRNYGGSGLGLSIAKRLVTAMNGVISINSEVNIGTEVMFTCRLLKDEKNLEAKDQSLSYEINTQDEEVLSDVAILLAEDNEFNQKFMVRLLEGHGAVCSIAKNGQEAIDMAMTDAFDIILMDLHMPIVNGMEATKNIIEQNEQCPPIIGLTADITASEQNKLISAGAQSVSLSQSMKSI